MTTPPNPDLQNILLILYHSYNGVNGSRFPVDPIDKATAKINHYILARVLELIGEDETTSHNSLEITKHWEPNARNGLRQELRAKAQERWGV